jgi:hypothetical protein
VRIMAPVQLNSAWSRKKSRYCLMQTGEKYLKTSGHGF